LHLYHERIWFQAQQPYHLYLHVLCQLLTKSNILNTKVWERHSFCWLEFFMCYIARDSGFKGCCTFQASLDFLCYWLHEGTT
jgi:hypothetical protein